MANPQVSEQKSLINVSFDINRCWQICREIWYIATFFIEERFVVFAIAVIQINV